MCVGGGGIGRVSACLAANDANIRERFAAPAAPFHILSCTLSILPSAPLSKFYHFPPSSSNSSYPLSATLPFRLCFIYTPPPRYPLGPHARVTLSSPNPLALLPGLPPTSTSPPSSRSPVHSHHHLLDFPAFSITIPISPLT